jgi:hypothetical protein
MAYNCPIDEFTYAETHVIEACTNSGETPTFSRPSRSLRVLSTESPSHQPLLRSEKLQFLSLDEWDERNSYDEDEPSYHHYLIE